MALPIFFADLPDDSVSTLSLPEDTARHVLQVLRMNVDDLIQLTDGKGNLVTAKINSIGNKKTAGVEIISREKVASPVSKLTIAISPVKNNSRFEWFLEKATEIGVNRIIPLICSRTEKQHTKAERLRSIVISAMLQSQQLWLPEISDPMKFSEVLNDIDADQKLIAHCMEGEKTSLLSRQLHKSESRIILIGPEGDFTKEEVDLALNKNYIPISLGNTRLRTETAGMVAAVLSKQGD